MDPVYPAESKKRTGLVRTPVLRSTGPRPLKIAKNERRYVRRSEVKSVRTAEYVFMPKAKFELSENLYLALARFTDGRPPDLYLIPSTRWKTPDKVFVGPDYEGLKSDAEWGLKLSKKHLPALLPYSFDLSVDSLKCQSPNKAPEPTTTSVTPRAT
jgi:hypothetical protein